MILAHFDAVFGERIF